VVVMLSFCFQVDSCAVLVLEPNGVCVLVTRGICSWHPRVLLSRALYSGDCAGYWQSARPSRAEQPNEVPIAMELVQHDYLAAARGLQCDNWHGPFGCGWWLTASPHLDCSHIRLGT
jgi:hypothetical protein